MLGCTVTQRNRVCHMISNLIFPVSDQKRTKRLLGEVVRHERLRDPAEAFKTETYTTALDQILSQFKVPFTDNTLAVKT